MYRRLILWPLGCSFLLCAQTVSTEEEAREELRYLIEVVA